MLLERLHAANQDLGEIVDQIVRHLALNGVSGRDILRTSGDSVFFHSRNKSPNSSPVFGPCILVPLPSSPGGIVDSRSVAVADCVLEAVMSPVERGPVTCWFADHEDVSALKDYADFAQNWPFIWSLGGDDATLISANEQACLDADLLTCVDEAYRDHGIVPRICLFPSRKKPNFIHRGYFLESGGGLDLPDDEGHFDTTAMIRLRQIVSNGLTRISRLGQ